MWNGKLLELIVANTSPAKNSLNKCSTCERMFWTGKWKIIPVRFWYEYLCRLLYGYSWKILEVIGKFFQVRMFKIVWQFSHSWEGVNRVYLKCGEIFRGVWKILKIEREKIKKGVKRVKSIPQKDILVIKKIKKMNWKKCFF